MSKKHKKRQSNKFSLLLRLFVLLLLCLLHKQLVNSSTCNLKHVPLLLCLLYKQLVNLSTCYLKHVLMLLCLLYKQLVNSSTCYLKHVLLLLCFLYKQLVHLSTCSLVYSSTCNHFTSIFLPLRIITPLWLLLTVLPARS